MKKTIAVLLIATILASLTACSNVAIPATESSPTPVVSPAANEAFSPPKGDMGGGLGQSSMDTSAIKTKFTGVAYNTASASQTLDIYLPNEGTGPFPVIIAIHGGAFKMGNSTGGDIASMLKGVNVGYAVASINYRLSSEATFPAAIDDVKTAIRFIKSKAAEYNLNADKIAVWGDSAGGNLAALAGTSGDLQSMGSETILYSEFSSKVNAVVDWFGPLSFLEMDDQFADAGVTPKMGKTSSAGSPESQYIGGNIVDNADLVKKANPNTYITGDDPSFFIQHGNQDQNVPVQQSIDFAKNLSTVLNQNTVTIEILEGAGHGGDQFDAQANLDKVFSFLSSTLK